MKSLFEEMGGTYHEENGYLIPDLILPGKEEKSIGMWGQRHRRYLKEYKRALYHAAHKRQIKQPSCRY